MKCCITNQPIQSGDPVVLILVACIQKDFRTMGLVVNKKQEVKIIGIPILGVFQNNWIVPENSIITATQAGIIWCLAYPAPIWKDRFSKTTGIPYRATEQETIITGLKSLIQQKAQFITDGTSYEIGVCFAKLSGFLTAPSDFCIDVWNDQIAPLMRLSVSTPQLKDLDCTSTRAYQLTKQYRHPILGDLENHWMAVSSLISVSYEPDQPELQWMINKAIAALAYLKAQKRILQPVNHDLNTL